MNISDNARTILQKRYLWPGETPEGMLRRVANFVGWRESDRTKDEFFGMMDRLEFLPNSPTLMNAAKPGGQLSACFVLPVEDSMESIMAAATAQAMIFKSGGGCIGGESTLLTEKGPVDLKTFCDEQRQDRVLSFDPDTKTMQYRQVSAHHITPLPASRIYEVKMSGRCSVRASDWHPFFVWNGERIEERRADQLRKGDVVVGSTMMSEVTAPDWGAWLVGLILSDGAFDFTSSSLKYQYRRLRIAKSYESVIARAAEVMGCNYSLSCNPAYQTPVWELTVSGKKAEVLFESFGRDDVRCSNKRIPEWVWTSGASTMLHLLMGLLDGDGWYCNNKHMFYYDTISEGLAQDVMALCGCLGISASMRRRVPRRTNEQPIYEICMRTNASLIEAADRLSTRHAGHITGHKQFAIPVSLEYDKRLKEYYGVDFWKTDWWHNGIPMNRGKINILRWHHDGMLPINSAAMLLREIGENEIAAALDSAHVVKSVSISEKDDTLYDLTVPGTQTYVAGVNGFCVVHNTGFNFSKLRAEGSPIQNSIGTASGPVSFMELFDKVTDVVKAGGGRRGANMGILNCDHPDLEKFIRAKTEQGRLTNFNISVMATDAWMHDAVEGNNPLFDMIVERAWANGDPGMLFYDRINEGNTTPWLGDIEATNPCWAGYVKVLTKNGPISFSDLAEWGKDVEVYCYDTERQTIVTRTMRNPRMTGKFAAVCDVFLSSGETLHCTPNHQFYINEGLAYCQGRELRTRVVKKCAFELKQGDMLIPMDPNQAPLHVLEVRLPSPGDDYMGAGRPVYNGTVDDFHNYFVVTPNGNTLLSSNCGETPLYPYEACNLGSINISAFVNADGEVDFKRLEYTVTLAVRFLDDVIDMNNYPLPEIEQAAKRTRKIGLGIMGWADALIRMGIPYGSKSSIDNALAVWKFVDEAARAASRDLAQSRGAYPAYQGDIPVRNATRTCIAPTGTISLIADVSSGIEPVFAFEHTRMAFAGTKELHYVHPLMEKAKKEGWYDPEVFVEAHQVPVEAQIAMQSAFQQYTDLAVSKTINLPNSATVEDVRKAYLMAWDQGCKGITVYRDGCREGQVLVTTAQASPKCKPGGLPLKRPEGIVQGRTAKMPTSFGNIYTTLNHLDDGTPIEVFSTIGKSGADMESCTEAIGRLLSLLLRYSVPLSDMVEQMKGISGSQPVWDGDGKAVLSIPDAIARSLEHLTGQVQVVKSGELCPDCGTETERGEGCLKCPSCGWSRC